MSIIMAEMFSWNQRKKPFILIVYHVTKRLNCTIISDQLQLLFLLEKIIYINQLSRGSASWSQWGLGSCCCEKAVGWVTEPTGKALGPQPFPGRASGATCILRGHIKHICFQKSWGFWTSTVHSASQGQKRHWVAI